MLNLKEAFDNIKEEYEMRGQDMEEMGERILYLD